MEAFSPINIIGITMAIILDVFGMLCFVFNFLLGPIIGEGLSWIGDVAGALFFSFWSLAKGGGIFTRKSLGKQKKRIIKFLSTFIGEAIPWVGVLPFWTIFVISEIVKNPQTIRSRITILFIFSSLILTVPYLVLAQGELELTYPTIPGASPPQTVNFPLVFLLRYIYNFGIIIAGFLSFVLLVWGGFSYLFSRGKPSLMLEAKKRITASLFGFVLILASYLILNTINPQLTIFPTFQTGTFSPSPFLPPSDFEFTAEFEEIPIGALITAEYNASAYLRTETNNKNLKLATSTDPDTNREDYVYFFDNLRFYSPGFQGGLDGRRLMRINEVASTTLPALEMLRELSGEVVELMNEFMDYNEELYQKVLECTCNHCLKQTCYGNGSCDCTPCNTCIEPSPDVCPDRERMEELREKIIPSYYEGDTPETSPIYCEMYLMKYLVEHFKRFLDSNIQRPLVRNEEEEYEDQSYWHSEEAEELREKIQACISASENWESWISAPPRGQEMEDLFQRIEEIIWENPTSSLASVENKGTVSPITDPPQRDVQTNIEQLETILFNLKYIKHVLNPYFFPPSLYPVLTHAQFYRVKAEFQVKEFPWEIVPFSLENRMRSSNDPATFYRPLGLPGTSRTPSNLVYAKETQEGLGAPEKEIEVACRLMAEIPTGKTIDETIELSENILRELKNIYKKGHKVIENMFTQGELATTTAEELVPEFIELTSKEQCECPLNCETDCLCHCEEECDEEGNCTTHCDCECLCEGNACPLGAINQVYGEIKSSIQKINDLFQEIDQLIGQSDDIVEENEILNSNLTSIYESYFKLNSVYPDYHPQAGEVVFIGSDLCCVDENANCRNEEGELESDQLEERYYTLIEKLIEIQKLLNRVRDFKMFRYYIEELTDILEEFAHSGIADWLVRMNLERRLVHMQEIGNVSRVQQVGPLMVGGEFSLTDCQLFYKEAVEYYAKVGGTFLLLENWIEAKNRAHIAYEMCPPDPPLDCSYFDSRIFEKRTPLNCYSYDDSWFGDYDLANNFYCCIKK